MSLKSSKPNRRFQQIVMLLMLAVYLFFTISDLTLEVMHKISHAWQNKTEAPHSHKHGSRVHSHGEVQHQHEILAFLDFLVASSDDEKPLEFKVKIEMDKHLIQEKIVHLNHFYHNFYNHLSLFLGVLLPKHPWVNADPPEYLNYFIL